MEKYASEVWKYIKVGFMGIWVFFFPLILCGVIVSVGQNIEDKYDVKFSVFSSFVVLGWCYIFTSLSLNYFLKSDTKEAANYKVDSRSFVIWVLAYSLSFYFIVPEPLSWTVLFLLYGIGLIIFISILGPLSRAWLNNKKLDDEKSRILQETEKEKISHREPVSLMIYKWPSEKVQRSWSEIYSNFVAVLLVLYFISPTVTLEKIYKKIFPPDDYYFIISFKPRKDQVELNQLYIGSYDYIVKPSQLSLLRIGSELEHVYTHDRFLWDGKKKVLIESPGVQEIISDSLFFESKIRDERQLKFEALLEKGS